jgi:ParB family chromosome partitioning protein
MTKKRTGLGRGLGALLGDSENVQHSNLKLSGEGAAIEGGISAITIDKIEVNPFQPRKNFNQVALEELSESIKIQGIIQPITVRKLGHDRYQIISGERRLYATKLASLSTIPAYIRTANDQQMLEMALIENIQRENLNAIEIALSYQRLIAECNLKHEELGDRVGKNRTTVNNYLRLLKLPPNIQVALRDGNITMGHARALINIEDIVVQLGIFNKIISDDLSVRAVEQLVRNTGKKTAAKQPSTSELNYEFKQLQQKLSSHFGSRISIKTDGNNKGEIKIPFTSSDDLNRILDLLDL